MHAAENSPNCTVLDFIAQYALLCYVQKTKKKCKLPYRKKACSDLEIDSHSSIQRIMDKRQFSPREKYRHKITWMTDVTSLQTHQVKKAIVLHTYTLKINYFQGMYVWKSVVMVKT